ncbi:MAG: OmpA family protein [Bacteroidetes bacterium]|nr:MAG: OmpA family protein [Bacteroidota bacterium]
MKYQITLFLAFWLSTSLAWSQCMPCENIYVWDFITQDGSKETSTKRLTRQFSSTLDENRNCKIIKRNRISQDFQTDDELLDPLKFSNLSKEYSDSLIRDIGARTVVFGTLFSEVGEDLTLSLVFEQINENGEVENSLSKDVYFIKDDLEDGFRIETQIEKILKSILCNEEIATGESVEAIMEQLEATTSRLETVQQTPPNKRTKAYYEEVQKIAQSFKSNYDKYKQLRPSINELEKFELVEADFVQQIENVQHDLLFSKLVTSEEEYDNLFASYKIGKSDVNTLIKNRELAIEICQKLIEGKSKTPDEAVPYETIKLNCYNDLQYLYEKTPNSEKTIAVIKTKIKELTPDFDRVLGGRKSIASLMNKIIPLNVYFSKAQEDIIPKSYEELYRLGDLLTKYPNTRIELIGHTDNVGESKVLLEISKKRAEKIKYFLTNSRAVDPARITTMGFGGTIPVADNSKEETRQLNRRVEVVFREQ